MTLENGPYPYFFFLVAVVSLIWILKIRTRTSHLYPLRRINYLPTLPPIAVRVYPELKTHDKPLFPQITMATIGSLVFCSDCGNLLPPSKGNVKNILHCDCCGADNKGQSLASSWNLKRFATLDWRTSYQIRHPRRPSRRANPPTSPRYYVKNYLQFSPLWSTRSRLKLQQTKHATSAGGKRSGFRLCRCAVPMKEVLYFTHAIVGISTFLPSCLYMCIGAAWLTTG